MEKTKYTIDFICYEQDHIDNNNFISCWFENVEYETLEEAIKFGYEFMKKRNYKYFFITKNGDLNQFLFDSKIYDETGKYKADDQ